MALCGCGRIDKRGKKTLLVRSPCFSTSRLGPAAYDETELLDVLSTCHGQVLFRIISPASGQIGWERHAVKVAPARVVRA